MFENIYHNILHIKCLFLFGSSVPISDIDFALGVSVIPRVFMNNQYLSGETENQGPITLHLVSK